MFGYWIQKHDYSMTEEVMDASLAQAIRAFEGFDWTRELEAYDEEDESRDSLPGIVCFTSLGSGSGKVMHLQIIFKDATTVFFNFHYPETVKLLGLFPTTKKALHRVNDLERARVPELLRLFFELRTEDILGITG